MIQKNWQELIKPTKLDVKSVSEAKSVIVAEPLEWGFGLTLGNGLRRVLLSSLQGAAVTAVQIDGVLHEFSSIAGVREDVTDIVLNIKEIAIRMEGEGPKRMVIRKEGPAVVTAADIQTIGDVEILNPDHQICTLDEGAEIRMELTVNTGKGYVAAERSKEKHPQAGNELRPNVSIARGAVDYLIRTLALGTSRSRDNQAALARTDNHRT